LLGFTQNSTWIVPNNVERTRFEMWGGAGGGIKGRAAAKRMVIIYYYWQLPTGSLVQKVIFI
jgi:hypothetical protein